MASNTNQNKPQPPRNSASMAFKARSTDGLGQATSFRGDKYDVSQMQYPNDLMSNTNEYGGNYVIFYINVSEDSMLLTNQNMAVVTDPSAIPPRLRGQAVDMALSKTAATAMGAVSGALFGSAGGALVGKAVGVGTAAQGAAVGGAIGAAANNVTANQAPGLTRAQKRLKQAIALYVPEDVSIKYGVDWSAEDTTAAAALAAGSETLTKAFKDGEKENLQQSGQAMSNLGQTASNAAKTALTVASLKSPETGNFMSIKSGLAVNPKKEQVFKGVDFRTFSFNYKFHPRSSDEAKNIIEIIKAFKLHMHPEFKDEFNFLYIYPSEFDIFYYTGGKENMNLHRHTSCVLSDMTVNYSPSGVFTAFPDGMPTQINITLTFKELALLTKQEILDGF